MVILVVRRCECRGGGRCRIAEFASAFVQQTSQAPRRIGASPKLGENIVILDRFRVTLIVIILAAAWVILGASLCERVAVPGGDPVGIAACRSVRRVGLIDTFLATERG